MTVVKPLSIDAIPVASVMEAIVTRVRPLDSMMVRVRDSSSCCDSVSSSRVEKGFEGAIEGANVSWFVVIAWA